MAGSTDLEWAFVPEPQRFVSKFWQDCNYFQALRRALDQAAVGFGFTSQLEQAPRIEVADTEPGLLIGARRDAPAGQH